MFNGIIFNQGTVKKILKRKSGINLFLESNIKLNNQDLGISVSCDGACLTLTSIRNKLMEFYLSNETIKRSKFKNSKIGDKINLELPLKHGQRVSGHICQGHVDTIATINKIIKEDKSLIYDFKINKNFKKYLVEKASILINGASLTISKITKIGFQTWIIPHTLKLTNLCQVKKGDFVNIEIDILSKYAKKYFNEK
tara:strand:- start:139 stop:729 length:591 start_codon:yes stop_codon:yes gene_type:complete